MIYNLNNNVRVNLTEAGIKVWQEHNQKFIQFLGKPGSNVVKPEDIGPVWEGTLFNLLNIFGEHTHTSLEPLFIDSEITL